MDHFNFCDAKKRRSKLTYRLHYEDKLMVFLKHTRFFESKKVKHPALSEKHAACLRVPPIKAGECKKAKDSSFYIYLMMFDIF